MATLHRSVASIRVAGDTLQPAEVTARLGATPTTSYARGDVLALNNGHGRRTARFGFWCIQTRPTQPADLDAQVAEMLERLNDDLTVWRELTGRFAVDLFCGWFLDTFNEGIEIAPTTLGALAERRIPLSLDIYGQLRSS